MLPSQNARPTESRAHMYRRGKSKPWLAIGSLAAVVVACVFAVKWIAGRGEPAAADANSSSLQGGNVLVAPTTMAPAEPGPTPPQREIPAKPPAVGATTEQTKIAMGGKLPGAPTNAPAKDPPAAPRTSNPPAAANTPAIAALQTPARGNSAGVAAGSPGHASPAPAPAMSDVLHTPAAPVSQRVQAGLDLIQQNKPVAARRVLSDVLLDPGVTPADADRVRTELSKLSDRLVFSPEVAAGDPFAETHVIVANEALVKLPKKLDLDVDWRFLQRINRINDPGRIQVGQRLKVIKGPFHAVVDKRTFRLDLYMGDGTERVFVRSFPVGLGEYGATPEGEYVVKPNSKLVNPAWTNPRTGEHFASKDPKNPLGAYWIGLVGVSDNIKGLEGYGVHGTIDPASIGQEKSMGCVRMLADDIALIYEVLVDNVSHVEIRGNDWP